MHCEVRRTFLNLVIELIYTYGSPNGISYSIDPHEMRYSVARSQIFRLAVMLEPIPESGGQTKLCKNLQHLWGNFKNWSNSSLDMEIKIPQSFN